MRLTEFDNMRLGDGKHFKEPLYVFETEDVFDCESWDEVRRLTGLICTLFSDFKASMYLKPEYAKAKVKSFGLVDNHMCVYVEMDEERKENE